MAYKVLKLDHIGIAVERIDDLLDFYRSLPGVEYSGTEVVSDQKVKTAFISVSGTDLELIEPTADDSPIQRFLSSGRKGVHHIALEVDDIEDALNDLKTKGVKLIDEKPRCGAHNKKIAFVHPASTGGVLLELCQVGGD